MTEPQNRSSPEQHQSGADIDPPKAGLLATVRAVAAAFFGVRSSREHNADTVRLNPIAVIAVGIGLAVIFVLTLLAIVKMVTP
jgi:hypothetical protein